MNNAQRFAAVLLFAGALSVPLMGQAGASAKSSLHASRTSVSSSGGPVAVRAHLVKTSGRCAWSVNPKIKGFADKVKCRASMARVLHVPRTQDAATSVFRVTLKRQSEPRTVLSVRITRKGKAVSTVGGAGLDVTLGVSLDPSYVQDSSDPYEVTWSYSASASETTDGITQGDSSLPDGVMEFFSDGSLVNSSDVGGSTTSAQSTVTYSSWGDHSVDVVYDSGTSSGTTGPESYDIEPPAPSPLVETWGTSAPSEGPSISATVSEDETSDDVTLTDGNFEGAQSVTLTDDDGNHCTATVSRTTAECTMDNTAAPTSFVVGFPSTQTTQTVYPYGIAQTQEVDWPADQVTISDPSVTTPETIDVSNEIPEIYAQLASVSPGYCGTTYLPSGGYCVMMGVEGLPAGGTLQLTDTYDANGDTESCSVDLATNYDATTQGCSVLTDPTDSGSDPRSITATYSGATISGYDTYVYAPVSVTYTMVYDPASGQWWNFYGN